MSADVVDDVDLDENELDTETEDDTDDDDAESSPAEAGSSDSEVVKQQDVIDETHPEWAKLEKQWASKVRVLEKACEEAEIRFSDAKKEAICFKKEYEGKVSELRRFIGRGPSLQPELPFDDAEKQADSKQQPHNDSAQNVEQAKIAHHEELMSKPIEEALTLTKKQREKLEEAGVKTVGDFEQLRGGQHKDYPGGLRDLPRVGDATVDKWEEEIIDWLKRNELAGE